MTKRVIRLVREQIATRFKPPKGADTYPGGQRAIAEQMHIAQPTLNRLIKKGEGVGLDLVLGLRAYFRDIGEPRTLDEILWEPDAAKRPVSEDVVRKLRYLEAKAREYAENPPNKTKAKQFWKDVESLRLSTVGTLELQRKVDARREAALAEDVPRENLFHWPEDSEPTEAEKSAAAQARRRAG